MSGYDFRRLRPRNVRSGGSQRHISDDGELEGPSLLSSSSSFGGIINTRASSASSSATPEVAIGAAEQAAERPPEMKTSRRNSTASTSTFSLSPSLSPQVRPKKAATTKKSSTTKSKLQPKSKYKKRKISVNAPTTNMPPTRSKRPHWPLPTKASKDGMKTFVLDAACYFSHIPISELTPEARVTLWRTFLVTPVGEMRIREVVQELKGDGRGEEEKERLSEVLKEVYGGVERGLEADTVWEEVRKNWGWET